MGTFQSMPADTRYVVDYSFSGGADISPPDGPLDTALGRVYPGPMGWSRVVVALVTTALLMTAGALSACAASDPRSERARALLDEAIPAEGPGCSAAVAERGEVVWTYARGVADLDRSIPIDTSTRFNVASVTKQFTAT